MENNRNYSELRTNTSFTARFKNLNSDLYLDVYYSQGKGAKVIQCNKLEQDNQRWKLDYISADDAFTIRPLHAPQTFLSVDGKSSINGANIIIWADETPTKWKIEYDEEYDAHRIVSEYGGYAKGIAVKDASIESGAETVIWDKTVGGTNDRWIIEFL